MPNDVLLQRIPLQSPPDQRIFLEADLEEQLILLSEAWYDQTTALRMCNSQIDSIVRWKVAVKEQYKDSTVEVY